MLDLGAQPACDYFPSCEDLAQIRCTRCKMWLCASCGLAHLLSDPTVPEEPKGTEPAALAAQARDAVARVAAARADGGASRRIGHRTSYHSCWRSALIQASSGAAVARDESAEVR